MSDAPLFPPAGERGWGWPRYLVYADRIELQSVFGKWVVPLDEVREAVVRGPLWGGFAGPKLRSWWAHFKFGFADFRRHVMLETEGGRFRWLHFCPPDPDGFVAAVAEAKRQAGQSAGPAGS